MPASSFSEMNSWGAYLLASMALVLLLSPQLLRVARDSRASSDWRYADGVRAVVDSLAPGAKVEITFGVAKVSDPVQLLGHHVICFDGNGTISLPVRWDLPNTTLAPGMHYRLSLSSGEVVVEGV